MFSESIPLSSPAFDRINRRTYRSRGAIRQFASASGWLEPGEQFAIELAADAVRGGAILDIGVGGGRTAPLMANISRNYRGIDYCAAMVAASRNRYPSLCFHEMDARRLTFADNSFDLVTFSYNGIDSVDLAGRLAVLQQVHRVLQPGGYFVFSTLNIGGVALGERWPDFRVFRDAFASPARLLRAIARFGVGGANWLRGQRLERTGTDLAISTLSAHNFGLITLFTSISAQLQQLCETGLGVEAIFDPGGNRIAADGSEPTDASWCHFVVRKPRVAISET